MSQASVTDEEIEIQNIGIALSKNDQIPEGKRASLIEKYDKANISLIQKKINERLDPVSTWTFVITYLFISIAVLFLPYIILFFRKDYSFVEHKHTVYLVSVVAILWIQIVTQLCAMVTSWYNRHGGMPVSDPVMGWVYQALCVLIIKGFPFRTIVYSVYLAITILSQMNNLEILHIQPGNLSVFIEVNQYAIVLLIAMDRIVKSFKEERIIALNESIRILEMVTYCCEYIPIEYLTLKQLYGVQVRSYMELEEFCRLHTDMLGRVLLQMSIRGLNPVLFKSIEKFDDQSIDDYLDETIEEWLISNPNERTSMLPEIFFDANNDHEKSLFSYATISIAKYRDLATRLGEKAIKKDFDLSPFYKEIIGGDGFC